MDVLSVLKDGVIKHKNQGYALYFYNNGKEYKDVNGKVEDVNSNDINYDSCFRLASVSKQFIAFAIVKLVNDNKLSYDKTIKELYPELPDFFNNITIKNLLHHTSGIYDYEDMEHGEAQLQDEEIIDFLKTTSGTYFEPGTTHKYSNTAYILLGLIITKVSGIHVKDYIEEKIFKEAGMNDSYVNIQGVTEIRNRSYGHILKDGELVVKDQYWCSATIGDGGLYSTVNDLKKWCTYLYNSNEFKEMKIPNYINEQSNNEYGYGIRIIQHQGKEIYYHCGSTIGTNTIVLFSKDLNICLVFLTNLNGIDCSILRDNVLKILNNK